jgi:phage N-6-adenine-methyltransferase
VEQEVNLTEEIARANPIVFASASSEWTTPQPLFDSLDHLFDFTLDVCATPENAKCERYFTAADDGLKQEWNGVCWCNPPYGRGLGKWVRKAFEASENGTTVVMLLPAFMSNAWWHDYVIPHGEIISIRGRLQYGGVSYPAPFSSVIVVFGRYTCGANRHLKRCPGCKEFFFAARSDATRCSVKCRMAQSRAKHRRKASRRT